MSLSSATAIVYRGSCGILDAAALGLGLGLMILLLELILIVSIALKIENISDFISIQESLISPNLNANWLISSNFMLSSIPTLAPED